MIKRNVFVILCVVVAVLLGVIIAVTIVNRPPNMAIGCEGKVPTVKVTNIPAAKDLWLQLVKYDGETATFSHYNFTTPWDYDLLQTGIGDLSSSRYVTLTPGEYVLWGWTGGQNPLIYGFPGFVFVKPFSIPGCASK